MRGASEAAAMLGLSSKMTRTELLHLKHTGNAKEFSDYVQERILDEGHRVEALARPIIAARIGQKLYPVTCSNEDAGGNLSASCDGLTMDESQGWEHKQWNLALAEAVAAGELPEEYMPQPQQCMLVTGAEEWVFTVSDGTEENMVSMTVKADPAWFDRILKGWAQFEIDLANYVPRVAEVKPVGKTPETLPALLVEVTGMVTNSNLEQYKEHALAVFAGINRELKTDQHFADAEKIVKWCCDVESRLEQVKEHALGQTQSIDTLFKTIDDIKAKARETRLELNKLVDKRKGEVKDEMVLGGKRAYETHLASLKEETGGLWVPIPQPDFAGAIKGKRSLENMQDAVDTMLSVYKVAANDAAARIRANLAALKADGEGYEFLFNDRAVLIGKSLDDLKLLIKSRITDHKAAKEREEEATRERIRAEEQAKADQEAANRQAAINAAAMGEIQGIQQQVIIATIGRAGVRKGGTIECIRETLAETEAWVIDDRFGVFKVPAQDAKDSAVASIRSLLEKAEARAAAPVAETPATPAVAVEQSTAPDLTHSQVVQQMPATVRQAMAPKPTGAATMTLGTISERLGFNVTSAFLATLEFEATTVKAAKLYHESDFPAICEAIKVHISEVQEQFEPATA